LGESNVEIRQMEIFLVIIEGQNEMANGSRIPNVQIEQQRIYLVPRWTVMMF